MSVMDINIRDTMYTLLLVVLVCLSAFFSGSETALMRSNRFKIRHLSDKGNKKASTVEDILKEPAQLISSILLGNNFVNVLASAIATALFIKVFGERGIVYASVAMTVILLLFAEITPKTIAAYRADEVSMTVARPLKWIIVFFSPVASVLTAISRGMLSAFGVRMEGETRITEEDIGSVIVMGRKEGFIQEPKAKMLIAIMDMDSVPVKKVMVPLNDVIALPKDSGFNDVIRTIKLRNYSRYPIYDGNPDNIIGYLHIRDLWQYVNNRKDFSIDRCLREAVFIPETKSILKQLIDFQNMHVHMAFVVDEYGSIKGMIALEDILEEIVGEIVDEHDDMLSPVVPVRPGTYLVRGNIGLRDLGRYMKRDFPEEFDTLGGLIFNILDKIPEEGDRVEWDGMVFKVERMRSNRIARVRITLTGPKEEETGKGADN